MSGATVPVQQVAGFEQGRVAWVQQIARVEQAHMDLVHHIAGYEQAPMPATTCSKWQSSNDQCDELVGLSGPSAAKHTIQQRLCELSAAKYSKAPGPIGPNASNSLA